MRKSLVLLSLLGLAGFGIYALAPSQNGNSTSSASRGLTIDCSILLKEYERIKSEVYKTEQRLAEFKNLSTKDDSISFLNRSAAWCKTALYALNNHLKHITNSYEHCLCEAGKIATPTELKILLEKIQKEHFLLLKQINALKTVLTAFQSQMQSGLN